MGKCRGCYFQYPDHTLSRDGYCEQCEKQRAKSLRAESRQNGRKSCSRCGDHGLFLYIDSDGLCDNCRPKVEAERREKRRLEALRSNYEMLKEGKAEPDLQRTYDAFHRKYPNALVTGVQVTGDSARINVYLAGGYVYKVTFNPLTNEADVSKSGGSSSDQRPISEANFYDVAPQEKKKGGCLSAVFKGVCWVVGIYFAFAILMVLLSVDSSKSSSTPKVTAAPTATAPVSDVVAWIKYYAKSSLPDDTKLDSVEYLPQTKRLYIICEMDSMWNGKAYLRASAEFISNFCNKIRSYSGLSDDVTVIAIVNGPFIDKEGNDMIAVGVRAEYSFEKIKRLNYGYFDNALYSHPEWIIEAADEYKISPAYLD